MKRIYQDFLKIYLIHYRGGQLILDYAGSPDKFISYLMHDILLKYEMLSKRFVKFLLTKNLEGFVVKHHGYRRTDAEIIKSANKYGFKLLNQENYAFVHEFRRSSFFNKVVKQNSMVEKILSIIGQTIPYIRMGNFKKVI